LRKPDAWPRTGGGFSGMLALFLWTPNVGRKKIVEMPTTNIFEGNGHGRSARVRRQCSDGCPRTSRAPRLSQLMLLALGVYFCSSIALWAQTSDSPTGSATNSWTATTESQSGNVNPTRTIENHTQSGNRTLDKQSFQRRASVLVIIDQQNAQGVRRSLRRICDRGR